MTSSKKARNATKESAIAQERVSWADPRRECLAFTLPPRQEAIEITPEFAFQELVAHGAAKCHPVHGEPPLR